MKKPEKVFKRVQALKDLNAPQMEPRRVMKAICDGGPEGIAALLGQGTFDSRDRLPSGNMILAGLFALSSKLGPMPSLKVRPVKDSEAGIRRAEKRERIVFGYDWADRTKMMMPQMGLWLPGYGLACLVIDQDIYGGQPYPRMEMRDPWNCFPGEWGAAQQPDDVCFISSTSKNSLLELGYSEARYLPDDVNISSTSSSGWANQFGRGVEVAEYYDQDGKWLVAPGKKLLLDFTANPLSSPQFVLAKRFSFNKPRGQYDDAIGLQAAIAEMNSLAKKALRDMVMGSIDIYGPPPISEGGTYVEGGINIFADQSSQVTFPVRQIPYQTFQQVDRMKNDLRDTVAYSPMDDGRPVQSVTTGQGTDRLRGVDSMKISEYRGVIADALERADRLRLEWDEVCYPNRTKPICGSEETYTPKADIAGRYVTSRVYGVMAGLDDPTEVVSFLQGTGGKLVSRQYARENMDGIVDAQREVDRLRMEGAEDGLFGMMTNDANSGDPAARMALAEIFLDPRSFAKVVRKYFTAKDPQPSPEEQALMGQPQSDPEVEGIMQMLGQ